MSISEECWYKDSCKIYNNDINCECRQENGSCEKFFIASYLYKESLLPRSQYNKQLLYIDSDGTDADQFKRLCEIEKSIKSYIEEGRNLFIHSNICGNGKTAWATRLLKAYLDRIWGFSKLRCRALFINVPRFLLSLKDSISNQNDYVDHIKANVLNADLVVWDEIATKALTEYEHEHLLNLINARLDAGKSNIYTSNMSGDDLRHSLGERLYSRITGLSEEIMFNGKDKRGINK